MLYTKAIVRTPGHSIAKGITTSNLGKPDYQTALRQHEKYIAALKNCGLEVAIMAAEEGLPDSTFIEDCAVLTERCAIITNLGIGSRKGEEISVEEMLKDIYVNIAHIKEPGTVEGGDVLRVGDHFYIGITARTNTVGANQLIRLLENAGYTGSTISVAQALHLKTGLAYLGDNNMVLAGEFIGNPAFGGFNLIIIDEDESYAANCMRVNDYVLVPAGYRRSKDAIAKAGYNVIEIDVSEFGKIDGGISCLSLRY
jgi:dimethylargininase